MKFALTAIIANGSIGAACLAFARGHTFAAGVLGGLATFFVWQVGKSAGREEVGGVP